MYVPNNQSVFTAAYAGTLAGMGVSNRVLTDPDSARYDGLASIAGAFAQEFDTQRGVGPASDLELESIGANCEAAWFGRTPTEEDPFYTPSTYTDTVLALLAIIQAGKNYFVTQGIDPVATSGSVPNLAALTALGTSGLAFGDAIYVETIKTVCRLNEALTLQQGSIFASDDPAKVWVRDMGFSPWTYQWKWFYDKDNGDDENDGASAATAIKSLDEFCRRVRVFSTGLGGVQEQYVLKLLTDTNPDDTWFPSGLVDASDLAAKRFGSNKLQVVMLGYRHTAAPAPGSSGFLSATALLSNPAARSKATLPAIGDFSGHIAKQVMVADLTQGATASGVAASISAVANGIATLTDGSGFDSASVDQLITISGATDAANNGTFVITETLSATSVNYSNPNAVAPDASNGAIVWSEKRARYSWIINAPAFAPGTGITVSDVNAGIATLIGAPGGTFTDDAVGKRIALSNGAAANNGEFTILEFASDTSVKIANPLAVVDATVQDFEGRVEMGSTWYNAATGGFETAPPTVGSPFILIDRAIVTQRAWGAGLPQGVWLGFTDCDVDSDYGSAAGLHVQLTFCSLRRGSFQPNFTGENTQSLVLASHCCWDAAATGPFKDFIMQENGYLRMFDSSLVGFNFVFREGGVLTLWVNSVVQGGFFGLNPSESGPRAGGLAISVAGGKGIGVFNNIKNSATNPSAVGGSAGAAMILARLTRMSSAGIQFPFGPVRVWGVGALVGMHIKEHSYWQLATSVPTVTDSAGQAGFPVREVKIDSDAAIPTFDPDTGLAVALATTSGVATTFVESDGLVTITDAAAVFTSASVGRTVTIAGANTAANNGTYPIESFIGATSVVIRNPTGVTDAVSAGTMKENQVITQWAQLDAEPYFGSARNPAVGTSIMRVSP